MDRKFTFDKYYFIATLLLFFIEMYIGLFVKDQFVRPYVGDFLVVILIYCFVKIFCKGQVFKIGVCVLLFAFAVEIGQYFQLVKLLGLNKSKIAKTVIGVGFDWWDMLAYTLGIIAVLLFEKYVLKKDLKE